MDPESVIANARGEIDERLLTGTEGGILSRSVLADQPLVAYLHDEEVLQYLLAGAAAPQIIRGDRADPIETEGSYRTLLGVTDTRLLVVAGSRDGDRAVSLPYDEIAAIEHSAGVLTHTLLVRETPDRGLEVEIASGSDPAEAVTYARQRIETATGSDEWSVPGRDNRSVPRRDESPSSRVDGTNEVRFDTNPEPTETSAPENPTAADAGNPTEASSGWGLAEWAHEVATDRANEAATDRANETSGSGGIDRIETANRTGPSRSSKDPDASRTSVDSESVQQPGDTASAQDSTDATSSRNPMDQTGRRTPDLAGLLGSDDGSGEQPDLGAWIDQGSQPDPRSNPGQNRADSGTRPERDRPGSETGSGRNSSDEEAELVGTLFEALVEDEASGVEGYAAGGLRELVRDVARYAGWVDEHLDAGAGDEARAAAATADALAATAEQVAAERGRPELRDRVERLRAEIRRALVAAEFGAAPDDLGDVSDDVLRRLMQRVDPYDFEHLVADVWEELGYQTAVTQSSQDLGVDVVARRVTPVEQTVVIQAKRYGPNTKVGREEIQQYASLHRQERDADLVVVVTTGEFTGPAEEAAEDLNVKLVDGDRLLELIEEHDLYEVVAEHVGGA